MLKKIHDKNKKVDLIEKKDNLILTIDLKTVIKYTEDTGEKKSIEQKNITAARNSTVYSKEIMCQM